MRKQLTLKAAAQAGFTLIELIIVIVIIGILAAVAIPKYQDLTVAANEAAVAGVAGNLASAAATNYALQVSGKGGTAVTCATAGALLQGGVPTGYSIGGTGTACVVTGGGSKTAGFTLF